MWNELDIPGGFAIFFVFGILAVAVGVPILELADRTAGWVVISILGGIAFVGFLYSAYASFRSVGSET